jgi:PAS domain-containing protein
MCSGLWTISAIVFALENPGRTRFPLRDRNGNYRWFLSRAIPIRDSAGKVSRWFGTNTDISDSKILEEALFVEKERAQITLNSIADAVTCTDASGKYQLPQPRCTEDDRLDDRGGCWTTVGRSVPNYRRRHAQARYSTP